MSTQPARGMRDFLPEDVRRREYVVGVIRRVYDRYGFEPLETPAVENIETLLGKYGDEGNKLIFKILMRGEHEASGQADLALRYDLTVPLARVIAEHRSKLPRFFKRYQIQPVWRADRPARGRYREFYQCDIDSVGSTSPVVEAEQIAAVSEIMTKLGFDDFQIRLNHRGILAGILAWAEVPEPLHADALVALDKRDKIGQEGVLAELLTRGLSDSSAERFLTLTSSFPAALDAQEEINNLRRHIGHIPAAASGLDNLETIVRLGTSAHVMLDKSLARGLSYYTGAIMELSVRDLPGSLGGGGRYDNLIGMFLGTEVPACGFSLGLERILVVMQERGLFFEIEASSIDVIVAALEVGAQSAAMATAAQLRRDGVPRVDLYPDIVRKMDKLFKYVDQRRAKFIAIVGSEEVAAKTVTVRNVATKIKETMPRDQAAAFIRENVRN